MSILNYLFTGVVFMFFIEYVLNNKTIKKQLITNPHIGWTERFIGIFFWPVCLGIFFYNFFKQSFK